MCLLGQSARHSSTTTAAITLFDWRRAGQGEVHSHATGNKRYTRLLLLLQDLPMRVEYMSEVGVMQNVVLKFLQLDETNSNTTWELADVKANQNVKGRGLSKKQRMQRYDIPLEALERVRIYVDF